MTVHSDLYRNVLSKGVSSREMNLQLVLCRVQQKSSDNIGLGSGKVSTGRKEMSFRSIKQNVKFTAPIWGA
jgi:hypothetical protein